MCVALVVFGQSQLLLYTVPPPYRDGIGRAIWERIVNGQSPQVPAVTWYQVPAPISKVVMKDLPADVAGRAGPVLDCLVASGGFQGSGF